MQHVNAQLAFGPRPTGTEALGHTREFIQTYLSSIGWTTEIQVFNYRGEKGYNLIGRKSSAVGPIFVLGAHYDTRKHADQDPLSPNAPVPGANDGASGVAVLLELARVLKISKVKGNVLLAFFDAEDDGQIDGWDWIVGSTVFVDRLQQIPAYAIIIDMVGDKNQNIYMDANSDPMLAKHLWQIGDSLGLANYFIPRIKYAMLDDHTPFIAHGIPAVDIIDFDYPFWHTTHDTADKLSPDSLEHVGTVLQAFLESGGEYPKAN
jgi:Zn-dependent M28 family amino/carboxypeptidase